MGIKTYWFESKGHTLIIDAVSLSQAVAVYLKEYPGDYHFIENSLGEGRISVFVYPKK